MALPSKSSLKWNTIANLVGRVWSAILSIILVPFFVRVLGAEAYGLVGLFASLQVIFTLLDLGLSATINREISRNTALNRPPAENRDLLRTMETIYWMIGIVIGGILLLSSKWISANWVDAQNLTNTEIVLAVTILAISFAAQWPVSLYSGVLLGLQQQIFRNIISIISTSIRTLGALAALTWLNPNLAIFLWFQVIGNTFEVFALGFVAWRLLGSASPNKAHFNLKVLKPIWKFALSFNAVGVVGVLVSQADRLIISKTLPLNQLGYYTIALTAAGAMPLVSAAVGTAVFPRFSANVARDDKSKISFYYHQAVKAIAFPTAGIVFLIAFFSPEILHIWTQSQDVTLQASKILPLLALSAYFNAVANPNYTLLIASGQTKLPLAFNILNGLVSITLMLLLIPLAGMLAAAVVNLFSNLGMLIAYLVALKKMSVVESERVTFWKRDILPFTMLGIFCFGGAKLLTLNASSLWISLLGVFIAGLAYLVSGLMLTGISDFLPSQAGWTQKMRSFYAKSH